MNDNNLIRIINNDNYNLKSENKRLKDEVSFLKHKLEINGNRIRHQNENITLFKVKSKQILETSESLEQTCLKQRDDIEFYKKEIDKVINNNAQINLELDDVYRNLNLQKDLLKKTEGLYLYAYFILI